MINLFDEQHQDFIKFLNQHEVHYLVIGGVAVNLHGYNRGTGDMDIWISSTSENKEKLIKAIEDFGYDTSSYRQMELDEITMFSLGSREEPGHIEVTNRIAGIRFDEAYKRVQVKKIEGLLVNFIHLEDLIKNKIAAGRPRDLDDVENLRRIKDL